jgi:hypothetical protein
MNPWLLIGIGIAAYFLFTKGNNILRDLTFALGSITPDFTNFRFNIAIKINNPLPTDVPISAIVGNLSVNGSKFADYSNSTGFILKPGINTVEISAFPLIGKFISNFSDLLKGNISFQYTVSSGPLSYSDTITFVV